MIFNKVIEIYQKYYICLHCLGRMFALLGTNTTNYERGNSLLLSITMENHRKYLNESDVLQKEALTNLKLLAEKGKYIPAQRVLSNEGLNYINEGFNNVCYLCNDIFSNLHNPIFIACTAVLFILNPVCIFICFRYCFNSLNSFPL